MALYLGGGRFFVDTLYKGCWCRRVWLGEESGEYEEDDGEVYDDDDGNESDEEYEDEDEDQEAEEDSESVGDIYEGSLCSVCRFIIIIRRNISSGLNRKSISRTTIRVEKNNSQTAL